MEPHRPVRTGKNGMAVKSFHESICGVDNEQEYIVTECCKAREDSETENTCSVCKKVVYQWVCSKCGWDMNPHMLVI